MGQVSFSDIQNLDPATPELFNDRFNAITAEVNGNLDSSNLAAAAVTASKLASDAVTTTKLAAAAVTPDKFTNPYKFRAYRNAAFSTGNGTEILVPFDSESYDTNSNFDTGIGRYTAPVSGFYYFAVSILLTSGGTLGGAASLYKNGSMISYGGQIVPQTATPFSAKVTDIIQLTAGDYVEGFIFTNLATSVTPGIPYVFFVGYLTSKT